MQIYIPEVRRIKISLFDQFALRFSFIKIDFSTSICTQILDIICRNFINSYIFHKLHLLAILACVLYVAREREREKDRGASRPNNADTPAVSDRRERERKTERNRAQRTRPVRGCSSVWRQSASEN